MALFSFTGDKSYKNTWSHRKRYAKSSLTFPAFKPNANYCQKNPLPIFRVYELRPLTIAY